MPSKHKNETLGDLLPEQATIRDQQIEELQEALAQERDARLEDRYVFIVISVLLLDIVFFTVMPTFGGPLALLILELLILIPLARRMGLEEVARIMSRVIGRVSDGINKDSSG
tara:strand:- start:55 stop:393 length:339 start_codon:yes stop_codon:yes gene_type:complete